MSNAPPRTHYLPRTLAYPGLNLGKWSNIGSGFSPTTQADGIRLVSPLDLRVRTSFRAPYRPVKVSQRAWKRWSIPSITSTSLICNALCINPALCHILIANFDSTIYLCL